MVIDDKLIKACGVLVALVGAYYGIKYVGQRNTEVIGEVKEDVSSIRKAQDIVNKDFDLRLRSIETTIPTMSMNIEHIKESLDEIKPILMDSLRK